MVNDFNAGDIIEVSFTIENTGVNNTDFIVDCGLYNTTGGPPVALGEWGLKYLQGAPGQISPGILYLAVPADTPPGQYNFLLSSRETQVRGDEVLQRIVAEGTPHRSVWFIFAPGSGSLGPVSFTEVIPISISAGVPPAPSTTLGSVRLSKA